MKIAVVTEHFQAGGLETQLLGFTRALARQGHAVSFIVGSGANLSPLEGLAGSRLLELPFPPFPDGRQVLELTEAIARFCRAEQCDVVHLHPFSTLFIGALAAARARLPFVVTLHGPSNLEMWAGEIGRALFARLVLSSAGRVLCVSSELIAGVRTIEPLARAHVLANGVDLERFTAAERAPDGDWAVIARLDSRKVEGVRRALAALGSLPGSFRLRVFGDGAERGALEAWISAQPFAARVSCEGFSHTLDCELRRGYAGAAGMARSLLEAGALGLPVILAGYDGIKGLVRREEMARLSETNYSGRGLPTISSSQLAHQLADLESRSEDYDLRPWIIAHADQAPIWARYLSDISRLPTPDFAPRDHLLEILARYPERGLFSAETLSDLARGSARRRLLEAMRKKR